MPEQFKRLVSSSFVLRQENVDTDQIIPARFLTTTVRSGLGAKAFYDWRYDAEGRPTPGEPLNAIDPETHRVLVAGDNFGCGSSREHAPWALLDFGFRAVVSTRIADIFASNALKNGLLPVTVDRETHERLMANPGGRIEIDLEACELRAGNAEPVRFDVEPFARRCLIEGVDPLGWLVKRTDAISAFEAARGDARR